MNNNQTSIRKIFIKYALPSIFGMLIVSLQSIIDGIFVSRGIGAVALAAVNLSMPVTNIVMSLGMMLVSGGVVIAGIEKGRNNESLYKGYTSLTLLLLFCLLSFVSIVLILNFDGLCGFLGVTDDVYPYVKPYLGIMLLGSFFYTVPIFTEAFSRLAGKPNWVFISGLTSCSVNIILDYLFVFVFDLGMAGAATATCLANLSAAILLLKNIQFGKIKGGFNEIKKICYNGSSEMFTTISAAITMYIFNIVLMKHIGTMGVAAITIVFYIDQLVNISLYGLSQAMYPLVSYNLGAKDLQKIKEVAKTALIFGGIIGWSVFLFVLVGRDELVGIFANGNNELIALTLSAMLFMNLQYLVSFVNIVASSFHTAIERPLESVFIALSQSIIFVVIPLLFLPKLIGNTGIWLSTPIAEFTTAIISLILIFTSLARLQKSFNIRTI